MNPWPEGWRQRTAVMGVINITPDSFSDGGQFLLSHRAVREATHQLFQGADVLDLGAQSTRPGAEEVGAEEELRRLLTPLQEIRQQHPRAILSIDTFHAAVAETALEAGADWINDISGGQRDPAILRLIAEAQCPVVLMHSRGNSKTMDTLTDYQNVVEDVINGLRARTEAAVAAGVKPEQIIWDPGLGFAKTQDQNLTLLKQLERIKDDGFPLLVGPSRKRFIGAVLKEPKPKARIWGTAAVACRCAHAGVAIVRVHDVRAMAQTLKMAGTLWS